MEILITEETRNRVIELSREVRKERILLGMDMSTRGIEISPLYNPVTDKSKHNVFYTDYTSADESRKKHANYDHPEIVDLDFIWDQQKSLADCIPDHNKFQWAVACHVLEHVPDPIGWMNNVLDCLDVDGIFSIVLPNADLMSDHHRRKTEASDMIESWLMQRKSPGPLQIYDFLRHNISQKGAYIDPSDEMHYTKEQALEHAMHSWHTGEYLDVHCSVFSPWSFKKLIEEFNTLGIMNVEVVEVCPGELEFYAKLQKKGEPRIKPKQRINDSSFSETERNAMQKDIEHARKAFLDAVKVQEQLKIQIASLSRPLWKRILRIG